MPGELSIPMLPFERATRKTRQPMTTLTYAPGSAATPRVQTDIPPSGLLARLYLHFTATTTVTLGGGTAAVDWSGPWSSISKLRIQAPGGLEQTALSGFAAYLQNIIETYKYVFEEPGVASVNVPSNFASRVYAVPVNAGGNTWEFGLELPVAINEREALGLLMMQNSSSAFQFIGEFNPTVYSTTAGVAPILVTGAATATISGNLQIVVESFTVPDDPNVPLPPAEFAHTYREYYKGFTSTGDIDVAITDQHKFLSIMHHVAINSTPDSGNVDYLKLQFSSSFSPFIVPNRVQLYLQHKEYGRALPNGVFVHDFFNQDAPNFGSQRDWVDGQKVSDLRSFVTINSGAAPSSGSRILTVTRQLQRVMPSPALSSRG